MRFLLIRHGQTKGNEEKRYIGRTDEPLSETGREQLRGMHLPEADEVFVSPLQRCRESASLLYPGRKQIVVDGFRECDFGDFEGRNYMDLKEDPRYQAWIDSGGTLSFPGGESPDAFRRRSVAAFQETTFSLPDGTYVFVVHGGTIMAIMDSLAQPHQSYFNWQVSCGKGYVLYPDGRYEAL